MHDLRERECGEYRLISACSQLAWSRRLLLKKHMFLNEPALQHHHSRILFLCLHLYKMSRRRQRGSLASDSDDDPIIRTTAPASSHGADLNPLPALPERRSRARVNFPLHTDESRQWRRERLPFGLPDFFSGMGFLALLGLPSSHGGGPQMLGFRERHFLDQMQRMRPDVPSVDKRHLIDATTIVCTHNSTDELQCGICLQSLDQGAQLRMAQ